MKHYRLRFSKSVVSKKRICSWFHIADIVIDDRERSTECSGQDVGLISEDSVKICNTANEL